LPAIYEWREFAEAGGVMSYGTVLTEADKQAGDYVARILKGESPADLPIMPRRRGDRMSDEVMHRREFITLIGGAAAWPIAARAQQREKMRRIGVLMNLTADDVEGQGRLAAFLQGLQEAGWSVGRNVRVDLRWGAGDRLFCGAKLATEESGNESVEKRDGA
jgi:hypothetical protein